MELPPGRSLAYCVDFTLGSALETFASLKKIYIAIRCPKCLLLHSFKAYLSCCLLALQDCFCRGLHSVLLGGQFAVGLPVHLRRPPRADARDALAMLDPIFMLLRMEEYITFSAMEPFTDPTGWYLGLLEIVFSKRESSWDTVTLCLFSISLIAFSNFFLSL